MEKKFEYESLHEFKLRFFAKEKLKLNKVLKQKGCTDIVFSCKHFGIVINFTSPSGYKYRMDSGDVKELGYKRFVVHIVDSYENKFGIPQQSCGTDSKELFDFVLL